MRLFDKIADITADGVQFDSYIYALFLPVVFLSYWALRQHRRWQNMLLLASSYVFYGWWDWRFLGLIAFTSLTTWGSALLMEGGRHRRLWATLNIIINVAILALFKYYDFFAVTAAQACHTLGFEPGWTTLNLVLPVGISFYTLQAVSYTIDVYRRDVKPTRDIVAFMTFIAFFPQLVAGPIERARDLLPQMLTDRQWDYDEAVVGMRQILWGLAKKIIVADTISRALTTLLFHPAALDPSTIVIAAILFAIQIYADFSGYSDIAIGSARLLGIRLKSNFRYPYFSRNYREMWRRWHQSLMRWMVAYVYIPLGGSRCSRSRRVFNTMVVFALSGLWHGADWTFVMWGVINGLLVSALIFIKVKERDEYARLREIPLILLNFALMAAAFLIFRLDNMTQVADCLHVLAHGNWRAVPLGLTALATAMPLFFVDWLGRREEFPLKRLPFPTPVRWLIYWTLLALIAYYSQGDKLQYIYFQF